MRTTDPIEPERFQPLGSPIKAPAPTPQVLTPQGSSGIVNEDGKLSTTTHPKPWEPMTLEEAIARWHEAYSTDVDQDFLP